MKQANARARCVGPALVAGIGGALLAGACFAQTGEPAVKPATGGASGAFDCSAVVPSRSRAPAYRRLAGLTQCEGFFERSVSQPFIELVSLTFGELLSADLATQVELHTAAPVAARLLVQPQRSGPFYRMDAALAPAELLRWDAAPMLQATGLQWRDLGFLAQVASSGDAAAQPAFVPVATMPAGGNAPPAASPAYAVLRASVPVTTMVWRASIAGSAAGAWQEATRVPLHAFQRVTVSIDLPSGGPPLDVDVQALHPDGSPLPIMQFRVVGGDSARR